MRRKSPEEALFVRLPATAVHKLDRASEALGMRKKDLIAGLVSKYVDPDSPRGREVLGSLASHKIAVELADGRPAMGAYSFQPYDLPEVMNADQTADFLQIDRAVVLEMAEAGQIPGRKLGQEWRFSRAAMAAWLAAPERR